MIPHESDLHSRAYEHTPDMVGICSTGALFPGRSGDAPLTTMARGLLLEGGTRRCQNRIRVHYCPSTCASAASVWGSQKVMSMARYISMAVDRAARACSRRPVW